MDERGWASVVFLWMAAALVAMSLSVIASAKSEEKMSQTVLDETRALIMTQAALEFLKVENFSTDKNFSFSGGSVEIVRRTTEEKGIARLRCAARAGQLEKVSESLWVKTGDKWRAFYWREL